MTLSLALYAAFYACCVAVCVCPPACFSPLDVLTLRCALGLTVCSLPLWGVLIATGHLHDLFAGIDGVHPAHPDFDPRAQHTSHSTSSNAEALSKVSVIPSTRSGGVS